MLYQIFQEVDLELQIFQLKHFSYFVILYKTIVS